MMFKNIFSIFSINIYLAYSVVCSSSQSIWEHFHHCRKRLISISCHYPLPSPANVLSVSGLVSSVYVSGGIQYVVFCTWVLSWRIMFFTHIVVYQYFIPFLLKSISLYRYITFFNPFYNLMDIWVVFGYCE